MQRMTLETPTHLYVLRCGDDVEFLDNDTIEVAGPVWLDGGRMSVEAWQVRDLIEQEDCEGLEEIGLQVIESNSRASLN
jgi:hypothetical protein